MTARQLRKYIADMADDAEKRIKTTNMDKASRAFKEAVSEVTYASGKVKRSTSYLSKEEMRQLAYAYRDLKSLDTSSGYAQSIDWKENRKKYQNFVRNAIEGKRADGTPVPKEVKEFWEQFKTDKGNISKRGYESYKQYIEFLKSVSEMQYEFGYRQVQTYAMQTLDSPARRRDMQDIFMRVYTETRGAGLSQGELIKKLKLAMDEYNSTQIRKANEITEANLAKVKYKKPKSKTDVKVKQAGKLKEHGRVRRTGR